MRELLQKLATFFVVVGAFTIFFPQSALASPNIKFQVTDVSFEEGVATINGYFENTGDRDGYAKWITLDLELIADNGQMMWADYGILHDDIDVYVAADNSIEYTFYVWNSDIPDYHGRYHWRAPNCRTHWETAAG